MVQVAKTVYLLVGIRLRTSNPQTTQRRDIVHWAILSCIFWENFYYLHVSYCMRVMFDIPTKVSKHLKYLYYMERNRKQAIFSPSCHKTER